MSRENEPPPEQAVQWSDIEVLLDLVRVEEEAQLAVLEALGEVDRPDVAEFSWDWFPMDENEGGGASTPPRWFHP
jgi:hypothetical protein